MSYTEKKLKFFLEASDERRRIHEDGEYRQGEYAN